MKKCLALCLLLLMSLPAIAHAGSSAALFPAYDEKTGKWGYIDPSGQWAVMPQFETAGLFRGNYAAVSTGDPWDYTMGIIDASGAWAVEPHYFVDEGYDGWTYGGLNEGMYLIWDENLRETNRTGYFDVPSGYFSGLVFFGEFRWWTQETLVPIGDAYYDRTNGQEVITLPEGYYTDWLGGDSVFSDGYALILKDTETGKETEICFVSDKGEIVELRHLRFNMDGWACGLLCAEEKEARADDPPIRGYFDLNTLDWRIASYTEPDGLVCRFREIYPFSGNGYACVRLENGNYGHIDTRGNLLFDDGYVTWTSKFGMETRQITQPYQFFGDYAWIEEANVLIDPAGEMALEIPEGWSPYLQEDDEMEDTKRYYASAGGVIELRRPVSGGYQTGLMNMEGQWLMDPEIYGRNWDDGFPEAHRFFSEGLQAVIKIVGIKEWRTVHNVKTGDYQEPVYETKVGYVNERGEVAVDFMYDSGGVFLNGLAMVSSGNEVGYINTSGEKVFFWSMK